MLVVRDLLEQHRPKLPSGGTVCEIGSGLGDTASLLKAVLSPNRMRLHELSEEAREVLKDRFPEPDVDIDDAFGSSTGGQRYGLIAAMEVLEHVEADQELLDEIAASMLPGGWLLGSVPAYMRKWQDSDVLVGHYRRYEVEELRTKLRQAGLEVVDLLSYGFPLLNVLDPLRRLYYRRELALHHTDRLTATARSGVSRTFVRRFDKRLVFAACRLAKSLAPLDRRFDVDDGFVFLCRKPA